MRSTNIKEYLDIKEKEFKDLQELYVKASVEKVNVVYQKFSYTARAIEGKLGRIQRQIQGALNIVDNISGKVWNIENLAFIENLATEEFSCHIAVDAKFNSIKLDHLVIKVMEEMGVSSTEKTLKRLSGIKNHLNFNAKRYSDYEYRLDWIRDRYFEIAAFIIFENGIANFEYDEQNSIYDIVTYGEKTISELKKANLFFDVLKSRYAIVKELTAKDMYFERNH